MNDITDQNDMTPWHLEDVEESARLNPDSFFIPSESERTSRIVGDTVHLHFVLNNPGPNQPRAERMWVEITQVTFPGPKYGGILTNQPLHINGLEPGDCVSFEPRNIARILVGNEDSGWIDGMETAALVSQLVFENGNFIGFAFREEPDNDRDSGWRFMAGSETEEYTNDATNIRVCNLGWLADFDPTLDHILAYGPGHAFERDGRHSVWMQVTDWDPPDD